MGAVDQPECYEYIEQPEPPPLESRSLLPGTWMWIAVFAAVIIFEAWAVWTGNYTMSETVWNWPKWAKWVLGSGFLVLLFHLFLQR